MQKTNVMEARSAVITRDVAIARLATINELNSYGKDGIDSIMEYFTVVNLCWMLTKPRKGDKNINAQD